MEQSLKSYDPKIDMLETPPHHFCAGRTPKQLFASQQVEIKYLKSSEEKKRKKKGVPIREQVVL